MIKYMAFELPFENRILEARMSSRSPFITLSKGWTLTFKKKIRVQRRRGVKTSSSELLSRNHLQLHLGYLPYSLYSESVRSHMVPKVYQADLLSKILASFYTYTVVMQEELTPATAFASLAVWNELR